MTNTLLLKNNEKKSSEVGVWLPVCIARYLTTIVFTVKYCYDSQVGGRSESESIFYSWVISRVLSWGTLNNAKKTIAL